MDDEFKRKWLQWVLDFVQGDIFRIAYKREIVEIGRSGDISKLSRAEKFKLFAEVSFFASDQFFNKPWWHFEKGIEFSQNQLSEWELIAPQIQSALKELLEYIAPRQSTGWTITPSGHSITWEIRPYPLPELTSSIGPPYLHLLSGRFFFHVNSIPKESTPSNWAILNLARLMDGIKADVISLCKGCNLYFLNFSLREKIYCTPGCASRTSAQLRRERLKQNPKKYEAYLKKQKALTMKRYKLLRKLQGKIVRHRRKKD